MKWILLVSVFAAAGTALLLSSEGERPLAWLFGSADGHSVAVGGNSDTRPAVPTRPLIYANGVVEGKHRSVELTFEMEGRLKAIDVSDGQLVKAGQPLAWLDADVWNAKLEAAQAELAAAEARRARLINAASPEARAVALARVKVAEVQMEQTARDFDRFFELRKNGSITAQQWDEVQHRHSVAIAEAALARAQAAEVSAAAREDELQLAAAQIAQAHAAVRQAQVTLEKAVLRAPCDGVVLRVDAEPGELISLQQPQPTVALTNLDEIRVRAYVEELDALSLARGDRGYVTADGHPGHRYAAEVIDLAPAVYAKHLLAHKPGERVDVKVREIVLRLDEADELLVGLPVDVFIERGQNHRRTEPGSVQTADSEPQVSRVQDIAPASPRTIARDQRHTIQENTR